MARAGTARFFYVAAAVAAPKERVVMSWLDILRALALLLVLEGLTPLLAPARWRAALRRFELASPRQIRWAGAAGVGAGLLLLAVAAGVPG
jgi:uncharacterized protein YjeT (DUF2065 family)